MLLYENPGLRSVPLKWKATINIPNIIISVLILGCLAVGILDNWDVLTWIISFYMAIAVGARLYFINKARPVLIETQESSLRIVYSKYFLVKEFIIPNEEVKIELYESPHRGRMNTKVYYLYFYSRADEQVDIELSEDFYTLGKILENIHHEQKIYLAARELHMVEKYRDQLEWNKTTKGKLLNILYPLLYLAAFALLVYMCSGKD